VKPDATLIVNGYVVPIYRELRVECNGVRVQRANIDNKIDTGVRATLEISDWDIELNQFALWPFDRLNLTVNYPTTDIPPEDPYYRQVDPFDLRGILRQMWDVVKHSVQRAAYPERFPKPMNRRLTMSLIVTAIERDFFRQFYTLTAESPGNLLRNHYIN
jgi:hypothetical protein